MIKQITVCSALLLTPVAPVAAETCKAVAGQMADHCDNLNELPGAIAQTMTATSTSLTTSFALAVQNPWGGEFIERWPDQDGPAITFLPPNQG